MFKKLLKKLDTPENASTKPETWMVKWNAKTGSFSSDYKVMCQYFDCEQDAKYFRDKVREAINLLGHTYPKLNWVECEKIDKNKTY